MADDIGRRGQVGLANAPLKGRSRGGALIDSTVFAGAIGTLADVPAILFMREDTNNLSAGRKRVTYAGIEESRGETWRATTRSPQWRLPNAALLCAPEPPGLSDRQ